MLTAAPSVAKLQHDEARAAFRDGRAAFRDGREPLPTPEQTAAARARFTARGLTVT